MRTILRVFTNSFLIRKKQYLFRQRFLDELKGTAIETLDLKGITWKHKRYGVVEGAKETILTVKTLQKVWGYSHLWFELD